MEMGQFIAKNYSIEYDSAKLEIEVVPAFNDLIVVIFRVQQEGRCVSAARFDGAPHL